MSVLFFYFCKYLCFVTTYFVMYSVPSKLTRAVYPAESLRFGSVPFCSKDLTLCRSPSTAADQIPAQRDDTQHHHWAALIWISQIRRIKSGKGRKKHATVWVWRRTIRIMVYVWHMNANLVQNPFQSVSGERWERRQAVSSTHSCVRQTTLRLKKRIK